MDNKTTASSRRPWISFAISNAIIALASFFIGTVFTPEVQPRIYWLKDRAFGCAAPMARAGVLLKIAEQQTDRTQSEVSDAFKAAYEALEEASGCNTPESARALINMAALHCIGLGVEKDLEAAHNLIHLANTLPGASLARAYTALHNCERLSNESG